MASDEVDVGEEIPVPASVPALPTKFGSEAPIPGFRSGLLDPGGPPVVEEEEGMETPRADGPGGERGKAVAVVVAGEEASEDEEPGGGGWW